MLRSFSLARTSLLALIPLLALPARAQTEVVWHDDHVTAGSAWHLGLEPHPLGGAVVALGSGAAGATLDLVEVRRVSENGDRLWRYLHPVSGQAYLGLAVGAAGECALVLSAGAACEVVYLDAAGVQQWTATVSSVVAGVDLDFTGVGFSTSGHVYVAGIQDAFFIPIFAGRASVALLDRATGQEAWRLDRPAINDGMAAFTAGDAFLSYSGPQGAALERIDESGTAVYSIPSLQPLGHDWRANFIVTDASGRVAVSHLAAYGTTSPRVVVADAAGNVAWARSFSSLWGRDRATITATGDVVIATDNIQRELIRFGPGGVPLWTYAGPASLPGYGSIVATPDDGVMASSSATFAGSALGVGVIEEVDAAGVTQGLTTFPMLGGGAGAIGQLAVDGRGNVWVPVTIFGGASVSPSGATAKVVRGGDPSAAFCPPTQANSTGALSDLHAAGSGVASDDNVTLVATDLPVGVFALALASRTTGFVANPGGSQGNLCLGGAIGRYVGPGQLRRVGAEGAATLQLDLGQTPTPVGPRSIVSGETWSFQVWHRDANPTATSNFTNGVTIAFQ